MEYTMDSVDAHSRDPMDLALYLLDEGFLSQFENCEKCGSDLNLEYFNHLGDGVVWRCSNQRCRSRGSIRRDSFFAASNLPLLTQIRLIISFAADSSVSSTAKLFHVARSSITEYFIECRRMYEAALIQHPISFSGPGEYEVDELKIERVKVEPGIFAEVWVQSILERRNGRVYLHRLENRTRPQMVPPIQLRVPAGSVIFTDEHRSYGNIRTLGYHHATVNHSDHEYQRWGIVAGLQRNIHINTCEGVNNLIRRRLSFKTRRTLDYIDLILSEVMYRKSGRSLFDPFK